MNVSLSDEARTARRAVLASSADLLGDAGENGGVLGGESCENFAVKGKAGLLEFIDEGGV